MSKPVTVIVPVYSDWTSLKRCIDSLKLHLHAPNKVLLINDCGPEADQLEKNIYKSISNQEIFEYYRNNENIGFVKTCNRGVFELDTSDNDILLLNSDTAVTEGFLYELQSVLYSDGSLGAVSPRSNSAGMATIPLKSIDGKEPTPKESYEVYLKIKNLLAKYTLAVDAHGYCMLIKRKILKKYGLFDEIFSPGYAEETDFSLRIKRRGHKCLFANHAFVFHYRAETFTSERKAKLKQRNRAILQKRYPLIEQMVKEYYQKIDPVDWFADIITRGGNSKKIMIDLTHLEQKHNDFTKKVLSLIKGLQNTSNESLKFTIVTNPDVAEFFKIEKLGIRTVFAGDINELFHLGFVPYTINYPNDLMLMHRWCLNFVMSKVQGANSLNELNKVAKDSVKLGLEQLDISNINPQDLAETFGEFVSKDLNIEELRNRWNYIASQKVYNRNDNGRLLKERLYQIRGKIFR